MRDHTPIHTDLAGLDSGRHPLGTERRHLLRLMRRELCGCTQQLLQARHPRLQGPCLLLHGLNGARDVLRSTEEGEG